MEDVRKYRIRYYLETGSFSRPQDAVQVRDGISVSNDNYGYADDVFVASILHDESGNPSSILLLSGEGNPAGAPSRKMLETIRDLINHTLEEH